ncbi:probable purine permease 11 isoform X2 [Olea europaea var. sylvestris]|uniref:probable purine permease 11 isoform X1 n=1 Tax=Olea europaea var. sylvestris TaxID=158386 RepID=UPI000C1D2384|nr:probable purine permease 11 isoform X1 [Olea europaea var. sylvestris]XP_022857338.1 probable purine permease 11 isoform X2 [Olea europaea var. sylvestris]
MDAIEEVEIPTRVKESNSDDPSQRQQLPAKKHLGWWLRIFLYTVFLLAGQSTATLLGRLYYDKGGNSKWMATLVQSAGFPILMPLLLFFPRSSASAEASESAAATTITSLLLLYLFFGLLLAGDNMMYSYGLLYLPVSTYSLVCATQLAFNALFSFLLNSQKFTALTFNSLVLVTISATLLAVHPDSADSTTQASKSKYIIGFLCTLGASATYSLYLSLLELSFKKIIKRETFDAVLDMQIYPSLVATCASIVGLFASGEWINLRAEMKGFQKVIDRACNPDWSSSDKRSYTIRCRLTSVWPSNLLETMLTLKWVSVAPLSLTAAWPACWYDTSSTSNKAASSAASFVLILLARDSKARDAICTHCVGFQISSYQWRKFPSPFCFTAIVYFNKKIRF